MDKNISIPVYNISIDIPHDIRLVMNTLNKCGHHAFVVGGCVRDSLLGSACKDWDIATSATPDEVKKALTAYRTIDTGIKHGTVTALLDETAEVPQYAEITTFRTEGSYSDGRHPDTVAFSSTIEEDLSRRDFTINAMAYSPERGLVDIYGGVSDLRHGILRAVGDPDKRMKEDALRIMRALRFAARFGFTIESETSEALHRNAPLLSNISAERITSEFCDFMLCADSKMIDEYRDVIGVFIPEILPMVDFEQHNPFHSKDVWSHTLDVIDYIRADKDLKLAALFHDIGKPNCFSMDAQGKGHFYGHGRISTIMTKEIMKRMKFDNASIDFVTWMVEYHDSDLFKDEKAARKNLGLWGAEHLRELLELQMADQLAHIDLANNVERIKNSSALLDRLVYEGPPVTLADIAVNGSDLMAMDSRITPGPELGHLLETLLDAVLEDPDVNDRESLLAIAKEEADKMFSSK